MKYALEYRPCDKNIAVIHFDKKMTEIIAPLDIIKSYEEESEVDILVQNEICEDGYYTEVIVYDVGSEIVGQGFRMMSESIYATEGIKKIEVYRYEVCLTKSPHFEWSGIINGVVATVLLFLEPDGKATEMPFNHNQTSRKNKKGRKTKKGKTKPAEISWIFQES